MKRKILHMIFLLIPLVSMTDLSGQSPYLLIARNTGEKILASGDTIRVFGFATSLSQQPSVPGPTIYANEGDSVMIDLFNVSQGAPHTIHLHGLDVNQQNDGVGHLSFEVHHMDHGYYRFKAPHPGTYLYHCHVTSPIHVQAGMYGLVIIKPAGGSDSTWTNGYAYDQDFSLLMSEIDTVWHSDSVLDTPHDTVTMIDNALIPYYDPQFLLVNGLSDSQLPGNVELNSSVGEVNYIRLSNLGFYANRVILPFGLNALVIDSDGRPLPQAVSNDTVLVFPGERFGVLTEAQIQFIDSIRIEYLDMNTGNVKGEQFVKVNINGFFTVEETMSDANLLVYPNPGNGNIQLDFTSEISKEIQIDVFDYTGKNILTREEMMENHSLLMNMDLSQHCSGIYLIRLTDEYHRTLSSKVILMRD